MKHERFKQMSQLALYGELDPSERRALDRHLTECEMCRSEYEDLQRFHSRFDSLQSAEVNEPEFQEIRRSVRRRAVSRGTEHARILDRQAWGAFRVFTIIGRPRAVIALGAAAILMIGLIAGWFTGQLQTRRDGDLIQLTSGSAQMLRGPLQVRNLQFATEQEGDGRMELSFDAVSRIQMKGSSNDPQMQIILARALLDASSPGVRLRAVNAMMSQLPISIVDPGESALGIKHALVEAMRYDDNPGVRRQALLTLKKFSLDAEIKEGLLSVLRQDPNEGLRAEAIDALFPPTNMKTSEPHLIEVLEKEAKYDNNQYINQRAREILQDIQ